MCLEKIISSPSGLNALVVVGLLCSICRDVTISTIREALFTFVSVVVTCKHLLRRDFSFTWVLPLSFQKKKNLGRGGRNVLRDWTCLITCSEGSDEYLSSFVVFVEIFLRDARSQSWELISTIFSVRDRSRKCKS